MSEILFHCLHYGVFRILAITLLRLLEERLVALAILVEKQQNGSC